MAGFGGARTQNSASAYNAFCFGETTEADADHVACAHAQLLLQFLQQLVVFDRGAPVLSCGIRFLLTDAESTAYIHSPSRTLHNIGSSSPRIKKQGGVVTKVTGNPRTARLQLLPGSEPRILPASAGGLREDGAVPSPPLFLDIRGLQKRVTKC